MKSIVLFNEVRRADIPIVGGKGANLGEMTNANFPIPQGFITTSGAYFKFVNDTNIQKVLVSDIDSLDVEDTEKLERTAAAARKLIVETPMSEDLKTEIRQAYTKLGTVNVNGIEKFEAPFVAVRSSATAEDLPEASFAGQQETYLNVKGADNVINAVKRCWASLFTARAVYYRKKQGFSTKDVGLSAVVQRMVNSEVAGVMFTAEPTGDTSKIIIEGAFGLGESVVSGSVTPDTYIVDKNTLKIVDKHIGYQTTKIVRVAEMSDGMFSKKFDLGQQEGSVQKLRDDLIVKLAEIGRRIEKHYNHPQDIEWALENGQLFIVQSRNITTLKMGGTQAQVQAAVAGSNAATAGEGKEKKVILKGLPASPGLVFGKIRVIPNIEDIEKVMQGDILVTKMTSPDWVPAMRKAKAIITDEGGRTCHAAIVSRELGIPCVVGTMAATKTFKTGQEVTVNGFTGEVYEGEVKAQAKPADATPQDAYSELQKLLGKRSNLHVNAHNWRVSGEEIIEEEHKLLDLLKQIAMRIGEDEQELDKLFERIAIKVKVNVALPDAAERASKTGAYGVGLLRAEHMITAGGKHPAAFLREEKYDELKNVVKDGIRNVSKHFGDRPIWYRTFDARSDEFRHLKGGESEPEEDNPMIGWHGIRRDLDQPELLRAQLQAIKELRDEGHHKIGIMLPFVINVSEVQAAKKVAREVGLQPNKDVAFGVMVETPAAVWIIDQLIEEGIDFISFGTNDLTQLTLGLDRNNSLVQKHFSELHPAILRSCERVIKACKAAGVTTSICGQAANNPEMVRTLMSFGIDSISANIDAVDDMKKFVVAEKKRQLLEGSFKGKFE